MIEIAVVDNGIGIPADMLDYVFDEFAQVEAAQAGAPQGTGLGLPLSRRLAGLMGGGIEVSSVAGRGSTFTLTIPAEKAAAVPPPTASPR
jgi:signal transduction histidine kinase